MAEEKVVSAHKYGDGTAEVVIRDKDGRQVVAQVQTGDEPTPPKPVRGVIKDLD